MEEKSENQNQKQKRQGYPPKGVTPKGFIPFKPGQSGNPAGRPKGKTVTEAQRDMLGKTAAEYPQFEKIATGLGLDPKLATVREVMALSALLHAMKGNAAYNSEVLNRQEGKVADRIQMAGTSAPMTFVFKTSTDTLTLESASPPTHQAITEGEP